MNRTMDRNQFGQLLRSTIVPENISSEEYKQKLMPIAEALMAMMPEKLYRYRSCSTLNIDAFDKDLVYAVTADKFNDPYDTLIQYDIESIRQQVRCYCNKDFISALQMLIRKGMEFPHNMTRLFGAENLESLKIQILSCGDIDSLAYEQFYEYMDSICEKAFLKISDIIKKVSPIACFSETVQSVTMWSHYADNHEGFALEYDLRFIPTEGSAMGCSIFPVVYDDHRFEATDFIAWCFAKGYGIDMKQPDQFAHFKLSLHKSTQWEYEKEWRLFHNIQDGLDKSRATSMAIVPKAIYYGKNILPINRKLLHFIAREKGIAEYDMYIDSASFKYEMLPKPAVF